MSVFQELQSLFEQSNSPLLKFLNPGLTRKEIEISLARFKYPIPADFFNLYQWHNGATYSESHVLGEQFFFSSYLFPSLDRVKELYNDTATDKYIKLSHLPIFEDWGGPMMLLECNEKSKNSGMILEYDIGSTDYNVIITKYDSITSLFQTLIECYGKSMDDVYKIAGELNPKSKYWSLE